MSIFSKLFGRKAGAQPDSSNMPAITEMVVDTELDERPEELLARREESMSRIMEWLGDVAVTMRDITDQLKTQGESLTSFEHNARLQLDTLRQVNVTLAAQNKSTSEVAEHLRGVPRLLSLMPEVSRSQSEILERLDTELKTQSSKAHELLETFREVSSKLDKIPAADAEQADLLAKLTEKVNAAVEQETQLSDNMESLGGILKSMSEFTKSQADSLDAIQETTRTAIEQSSHIMDRRFKITAALIAALIGLILILGIIAIVRLPGG